MCGRFVSFLPPEEIARLFRTVNRLPNIGPSWNLAPTQNAMVVRRHPETGQRHLDVLQWGLLPYWAKDKKSTRQPINARAETVASAPMFRDAFARRRALVPASAFYEWRKAGRGDRQPFAIARADGLPMAFAGLWEGWRGPDGEVLRTFAIVTIEANAEIVALHDRMPVVLEERDWPVWLGEEEGDLRSLLRPAAPGVLRSWPVSREVNNVRNDGPELITPAPPAEPPSGSLGNGISGL